MTNLVLNVFVVFFSANMKSISDNRAAKEVQIVYSRLFRVHESLHELIKLDKLFVGKFCKELTTHALHLCLIG